MNKQYIETADGRFLKVEGGGNSLSVANAISHSPDPHYGASLDEEEPLPMPSLNEHYAGQGIAAKPPEERNTDDGPLHIPSMNFSPPMASDNEAKPKPKKATRPGFVMTEKNDGPLPLPRMKF